MAPLDTAASSFTVLGYIKKIPQHLLFPIVFFYLYKLYKQNSWRGVCLVPFPLPDAFCLTFQEIQGIKEKLPFGFLRTLSLPAASPEQRGNTIPFRRKVRPRALRWLLSWEETTNASGQQRGAVTHGEGHREARHWLRGQGRALKAMPKRASHLQ